MRQTADTYTTFRELANTVFTNIKGYPLDSWILDQRDLGTSYKNMEARLNDVTDGVVKVSYRTLARWANSDKSFPQPEPVANGSRVGAHTTSTNN